MLTIRRASTDDLDSVAAAYTAAWRHGFAEMLSVSTFMRDDFDEVRRNEVRDALLDDCSHTMVVELDGRVVGFSSVSSVDGVPSLDDLWVHPQAWGSGAAPVLLAAANRRATQCRHTIE